MVERDCNNCEFLSITEKEQNDLRKLGYGYMPHICNKYNKRVSHFPYQQPFIRPCEECEKEPCPGIDDNYVFKEDCEPLGFVKGESAIEFMKGGAE